MDLRALRVSLSLAALVPSALPQERVGPLFASSRIDFEGVAAFDARAVYDGIMASREAVRIAHPVAPRAPFLDRVRERIVAGYRFGGFRDVRVEVAPGDDGERLAIRVTEGDRTVAAGPRVVTSPENASVRAAVGDALAREDPETGALWREGGPARFGDGADAELRAAVLAACREAGAHSATVDLRRVALDDGTVRLDVTLEHAALRTVESIRFDGIGPVEAERLRIRIGFRPGVVATAEYLGELARAVEDVGRYRDVVVEPARPGDGPIHPLVVRLSSIDQAPDWDDMPWEEMEALRRALRDLGARFAAGAHVRASAELEEPTGRHASVGPGTTELRFSMAGLQLVVPRLRLSGVSVGDLLLAVDGEHGLRVGTSSLGELLRVPLPDVGPRAGAVLSFRAAPNAFPETGNSMNWGVGWFANLAGHLDGLRGQSVVRFGANVALVFQLHGASLLSILEKQRAPDLEGPGEIVVGSAEDPDAVRVDRATGHAEIAVTTSGTRLQVVDEPMPPIELRPRDPELADRILAHVPSSVGDGPRDALRLSIVALRLATDLDWPEEGSARPHAREFHVPGGGRSSGSGGLGLWLPDLGQRIADRYPIPTWPHVLARDLPWMGVDPGRTWPGLSGELERLARAKACGPLPWSAVLLVTDVLGADAVSRSIAGFAERACTFDGLWRDVEALAAEGSWTGTALRGLGAAWRAEADGFSAETAAALRSAEDELAAVRVGLRVLWDAGLGDALRAELRRRSR